MYQTITQQLKTPG